MRANHNGYKFNCRTKFDIGDIIFLREKNGYRWNEEKKAHDRVTIKKGPIKIMGIELRVDSKGKLTVWYNCESANFYKFAFYGKSSKHYVKEVEALTEQEVDELGWDVESTGYTRYYNPDGTEKPKSEQGR